MRVWSDRPAPGSDPPPVDESGLTDSVDLGWDGRPLARYVWRPDLPVTTAPRPYLHPVRTLGGIPVTDFMPASHPHHLGACVAVPDLDGQNFWGGRTYLPGHGPAWLDNHGVQRHQQFQRLTPASVAHTLRWIDAAGRPLLHEQRAISCAPIDDDAWELDFSYQLGNRTDRDLTLHSPAARGRAGAGYGGFFWRAPGSSRPPRVFGPAGTDLARLHGAAAEWIALGGTTTAQRDWTLVFVAGSDRTAADRWFVRTRDYLGVGSCLSWDEPLPLPAGGSLTRRVRTIVADGVLDAARAAQLAAGLRSRE